MRTEEQLRFRVGGLVWIHADWSSVEAALKAEPDAVVLGGNTSGALRVRSQHACTVVVIADADAFVVSSELREIQLGCGLTLADLERQLEQLKVAEEEGLLRDVRAALLTVLRSHSSPQVKATATVGGSIAAHCHYPFLVTLLAALDTRLSVFDREDREGREVGIQDYLCSAAARFVIRTVTVPLGSSAPDSLRFTKLAQHPRLKFCLAVSWRGVGPGRKSLRAAAPRCESDDNYRISVVEADTGEDLTERLIQDIDRKDDKDRYFEALVRTWSQRLLDEEPQEKDLCEAGLLGSGEQTFDTKLTSDAIVGQPLMSPFALEATAGETEYLDDARPMRSELHMALVSSRLARAKLIRVDPSRALAEPGVVDFVSAKDVPRNAFHSIGPPDDEVVFADAEVNYVGQFIGGVLADSRQAARRAAELVQVEYEPLNPVVTIEDAKAAEEAGPWGFETAYRALLKTGDVDEPLTEDDEARTARGEVTIEAQEHFYLETQSALVYPSKEKNCMVVYSSTHAPRRITMKVASVLDIPTNRVDARLFRIGGSFGGKETSNLLVCLPTAVAAHKLGLPVRCVLSREQDILSSGTRHPVQTRFAATIGEDLSIRRMHLQSDVDGGSAIGFTDLLSIHLCTKSQSAYHLPNFHNDVRSHKTNTPSCTAFRGFGHPQGVVAIEMALEKAAETLGVCPDALRERNLMRKGDEDAFGNEFSEEGLVRCWHTCAQKADYEVRKEAVTAFNQRHDRVKKGIALMATMMAVGYDFAFLNQAMAVINVEASDGYMSLIHSGVEIGQGIEMKMLQVAAHSLGLPIELFHTPRFSSTHLPNVTSTSGSGTTDLTGNAVIIACEKIKKRLTWEPLEGETMSDRVARWKKMIGEAYLARINLSFQGFFKHPGEGLNHATMKGMPGLCYTYGVACSEVALDCDTGEYRLLRTDIVMDVGRSLNPVIDIGQIEGGYMQGVGLYCHERLSRNPTTGDLPRSIVTDYGVPRVHNVPAVFNVHLLEGSTNTAPKAVFSSKGIGEPPLALGCCAYIALRRAVASVAGEGKTQCPLIPCPATPDRVKDALEKLQGSC